MQIISIMIQDTEDGKTAINSVFSDGLTLETVVTACRMVADNYREAALREKILAEQEAEGSE